MIFFIVLGFVVAAAGVGLFCIFFDQAIFTRRGTIYKVRSAKKKVALTFDDGPSPEWTPKILDELKSVGVKATFFMIGHHVKKYPEIARRVVQEGHIIGNHGYAHSVMLYYTPAEIEGEIKYTEYIIREVTGVTTKYFRPPKALLRKATKETVKSMGYDIILWSLNSKDWVKFNYKYIVAYLMARVKHGDIILFHDSGSVFTREGGDRIQTVKSVALLADELKKADFDLVTVEELLDAK